MATLQRNFLRQPGINNWDMGMAKNFRITERVNFKIAGDFFNAWNHHQYAQRYGRADRKRIGRRYPD